MQKRVPLLLGLVLLMGTILQAQAPETKLVLTARYNGLESDESFSCAGKIHGYLTMPTKLFGEHTIEGIWYRPNGQIQERSKNFLKFDARGERTAYIWIGFGDRGEGLFSSTEKRPEDADTFTGSWRVQVKLDDKPLVEQSFKMKCS